MAWTFVLRRATALAPPGEEQVVASAVPTVQRLGYALGAAYVGIVANGAAVEGGSRGALAFAAAAVFIACLPLALLGLVATARFVRAEPPAA